MSARPCPVPAPARRRSRWPLGPGALLVGWLAVFWLAPAVRAETLTLADCLREVAEHNPSILQERAAVERATATRLTLRARALPSLTVGGIAGVLNQDQDNAPVQVRDATGKVVRTIPGTVTTRNSLLAEGTGSLYQSIFDAAIPASYRRGTVDVLAAEQNFYTVASAQLHAARLLYYQALYQQDNGALLRRSDEVLAGNVKTEDQLVSAGLVGRTALLSAQVQRANFTPGLLGAAGTYHTFLASLLETMGRELPPGGPGGDPLPGIRLGGSLDEAALAFDPAEAARVALARRPDFRSLRALVKLEQEDANIARAGFYPLVRLYVAGEYVPGTDVRNRPNAIRSSDQVQASEIRPGVQGSWLVVDTGNTLGAVRFLEAQRDTVAVGLHRLETNLSSDLANVHARLADASGRIAALQGSVDLAQNTLNIIQGGLAQGLNSQTEFLFAQTDLLNLQTGLLAARLELSFAHAEFDRLTGNYLRYVEEPAAPTRRPAKK